MIYKNLKKLKSKKKKLVENSEGISSKKQKKLFRLISFILVYNKINK